MQITGQNQQPINPQYNANCNCASVPIQSTPAAAPAPQTPQYNPPYYPPQVTTSPGATGVNIQIFNPSVTPPGAMAPTYNVNAPNYYPAGAYPSNYYTTQMGQCPCCHGNNGNTGNNAVNQETNSSNTTTQTTENISSTGDKTEKKRVVLLNDDYIRNLENMLNSQDKSQRITAAKAVFERLDEDPSRKDDKALTALVNKMLQDPVQEVRLLALSALEGRICNGDDFTVAVLKNMQTNPQGQGFDAADASRILLDMSGQRVDKNVIVDPDKRTKIKTEEKKDEKKKSQIKSNNK